MKAEILDSSPGNPDRIWLSFPHQVDLWLTIPEARALYTKLTRVLEDAERHLAERHTEYEVDG